jgi:hypothetical protein
MIREKLLQEEEERLFRIKTIVDSLCDRIRFGGLSREEAERSACSVRAEVEHIAADKMAVYDLIYAARFRRLMDQFILSNE